MTKTARFLPRPSGRHINIAALVADTYRRFPKTMEALRQSELAEQAVGA